MQRKRKQKQEKQNRGKRHDQEKTQRRKEHDDKLFQKEKGRDFGPRPNQPLDDRPLDALGPPFPVDHQANSVEVRQEVKLDLLLYYFPVTCLVVGGHFLLHGHRELFLV